MELTKYNPDQSLGAVGVWIPFPIEDGDETVEFKIASNSNAKFRRLWNRAATKLARTGAHKNQKETDKEHSAVIAEGLLLDWRGNLSDAGEAVGAYDTEKAAALLLKYPVLRAWVEANSAEVANFQQEKEAADLAATKSDLAVPS